MSVDSAIPWMILGQSFLPWDVSMKTVGAIYASYAIVFGGFVCFVWFLKHLAKRAVLNNNTEAALQWYDRMWFLFGPAVRKEIKPQIQMNLAIVHASEGHHGRALQLLNDARRSSRDLKSPDLLIQACVMTARLHQRNQNWEQASFALSEARKASETDKRSPGLLKILLLQAEFAGLRGAPEEALGYWHQIKRIADARRDVVTGVLALTHIGRASYEAGEWADADHLLSEAVSVVRENHLTDRAAILACLLYGRLQLQRGQYELARGYLMDAANKAKTREEPALQCSALIEAARLWVEQGRIDKAEETCNQAVALADSLKDPNRIAMACQVAGDLALSQDHWMSARAFFDRALTALSHTALPRTALLVRCGLALVEGYMGNLAVAMEKLLELETEAFKTKAGYEHIAILDALARIALQQGDGLASQEFTAAAHARRQELGITAALSAQYRIAARIAVIAENEDGEVVRPSKRARAGG